MALAGDLRAGVGRYAGHRDFKQFDGGAVHDGHAVFPLFDVVRDGFESDAESVVDAFAYEVGDFTALWGVRDAGGDVQAVGLAGLFGDAADQFAVFPGELHVPFAEVAIGVDDLAIAVEQFVFGIEGHGDAGQCEPVAVRLLAQGDAVNADAAGLHEFVVHCSVPSLGGSPSRCLTSFTV